MSLLGWFSKRAGTAAPRDSVDSNLSRMEATRPFRMNAQEAREAAREDKAAGSPQARPATGTAAQSAAAAARRPDRVEHREQLYSVVRESMVRSGVLSSSYKFKVLSVDSRTRQYLVMMDLAREYGSDTARLSEMEVLMAQTAKQRFGILVSAVYWRMNDHVAIGQPKTQHVATTAAAAAPLASVAPVAPVAVATPVAAAPHRFEPIQADEVEAFRRALAASVTAEAAALPAKAAPVLHIPEAAKPRPKPWARRPPSHMTGYEDTEAMTVQPPEERGPELSVTQYGELH